MTTTVCPHHPGIELRPEGHCEVCKVCREYGRPIPAVTPNGSAAKAAALAASMNGHGPPKPVPPSPDAPDRPGIPEDYPAAQREPALADVAAVKKAHAILGRFAGHNPSIPSAKAIDEIVSLLYWAANPEGVAGSQMTTEVPGYPTKWLPAPMQAQLAEAGSLPVAGVGAGMLGCGSAATMSSRLLIDGTRRVVPTLWVAPIGDAGSGKTPAADLAFAPYHQHESVAASRYVAEMLEWKDLDAAGRKGRRAPINGKKLVDDATVELLARRLNGGGECIAVVADELATVLRGLGQYKSGGGSDRARFIALWSGKPWTYERVGNGENPFFIHIDNPVLPVFGTIQPEFASLLGDAASGMQARWLPHWCLGLDGNETGRTAAEWEAAMRVLLNDLDRPRTWTMPRDSEARLELLAAEERWTGERAEMHQTSASTAFLSKGEEHAARVALVLSEISAAGDAAACGQSYVTAGQIPPWAARAAVEVVDYCAAVWRFLPDLEAPLSRSWAEARIAERDGVLNAWLRKHGGSATRREIQRAKVAGAKTLDEVQALIDRHRGIYGDGSVVLEARGQMVVYAR